MAVACPYCRHAIAIKEAKPGKFSPKCPKCARRFSLTVAGNPPYTFTATESLAGVAVPKGVEQTTALSEPASATPVAAASEGGERRTTALDPRIPPPAGQAATRDAGRDATIDSAAAGVDRSAAVSEIPKRLGGYEIIKELGSGGMGAVYLARQLSLDRPVAVKVMRPQWAKNAVFVVRFAREAYAAAQLVHHNVVQIYDIGAEGDVPFFSMEYVKGRSLQDVLKTDGKLDSEAAVGYVLQAARGLKFAHDQGMIHRDIKPDNLMLGESGIVKVADLGLVKVPGAEDDAPLGESEPVEGRSADGGSRLAHSAAADVTRANVAMGTPAYMAPEQAKNAKQVDGRADIYALGGTLYALVTGRPLFTGSSAMEVMSKHASEPVVPPDAVVKRVPKRLSDLIVKMVAKRPEDRFQTMDEVIQALEAFLGVESAGPFSPREEHAQALEDGVREFNASPAAKRRTLAVLGFLGLSGLLLLIGLLLGPKWLVGFVSLSLAAAASYVTIHGIRERSYLWARLRSLVLGGSWTDRLTAVAGGLLLLIALWILGLLFAAIGGAVIGTLVAIGLYFAVDRQVQTERAAPVEKLERLLKTLRLLGIDETSLRQFYCKYGGEHWEGPFEALFGYEAKLDARRLWGKNDRGQSRPRHGAWRDPIVRWIDVRLESRREAHERRQLEKIEARSLRAAGVDAGEARARAEQAAQVLVDGAREFRKAAAPTAPREDPQAKRQRIRAMLAATEEAGRSAKGARGKFSGRLVSKSLGHLLGAKVRFILGALLMAACLLWMNSRGMLGATGEQLTDLVGQENVDSVSRIDLDKVSRRPGLFTSFNTGAAGMILVLSALLRRGWKISLFVLPAAAIALAGHWLGIPSIGPLAAEDVGMAAGAVLAAIGLLLVRGS